MIGTQGRDVNLPGRDRMMEEVSLNQLAVTLLAQGLAGR